MAHEDGELERWRRSRASVAPPAGLVAGVMSVIEAQQAAPHLSLLERLYSWRPLRFALVPLALLAFVLRLGSVLDLFMVR